MKKRVLAVMLALVFALCFTACGGGGGGSADEKAGAPVTQETYDALTEGDWADMSLEDYNEYFGKEGVVDEERSADWGEDYLVVDYYNEDETGYIHFLFKKNDDGVYMPSSISPSFPE